MNFDEPARSSYSSPFFGFESSHKISEPNSGLQIPYFEAVFSRRPIYDNILSCLEVPDLIHLGRTSKLARAALAEYSTRAYNINRHLLNFFNNPLSFRSLQARTGTVISGSNALQFLDRTYYPDADIDVYVHPGHALDVGKWLMSEEEGYTFVPTNQQEPESTFEENVGQWDPFVRRFNEQDDQMFGTHGNLYRMAGIAQVYSFEKKVKRREDTMDIEGGQAPEEIRTVQIIETKQSPFQSIMGFHSTCVLNLITFDTAYSLYPRATFKDRSMQLMKSLLTHEYSAIHKYGRRGFRIHATYSWPRPETDLSVMLNTHRNLNDEYTWRLSLDTTGVSPRPRLTYTSALMKEDPVVHNSWTLLGSDGSELVIKYYAVKSTLFRYNYVVADQKYALHLGMFARSQGRMEHQKVKGLHGEEKLKHWTWWDSSLPDLWMQFKSRR